MLGARSLAGPVLRDSLARIVNPLSYPRLIEFSSVMQRIAPHAGDTRTFLDIGSPKLPFLLLAHRSRATVYATDIRPYFIRSSRYFVECLGLGAELGRRIFLETQDATQLSYPDAMFDAIFSISVIEHIPGDGDSRAMREIARVLKPGARVSITVPFAASGYRETYVGRDVYERRRQAAEPVFYQRHYDQPALYDRLIDPSGLRIVAVDYFGEPGLKFERLWNRIPMGWKLPLLWAQPFIARRFLKPLPVTALHSAVGVCVTLYKETDTPDCSSAVEG
jgi:SAM-dependent methyltransferase